MPAKRLQWILVSGCVLGLLAWLAGAPLIEHLVESAYSGTSIDYVNKLVAKDRLKDPHNRTLAYYQARGVGTFGRLILVYLVGLAAAGGLLAGGAVRLRTFFSATSHPLNLAVFRIVLFTYLLLFFDLSHSLGLSRLGSSALVPPPGWGWAVGFVPLAPGVVEGALLLFQLSCLAGLLGLWTRPAVIMAALAGFYVLGLAQFFGKVNHYHHLWWFMVLLACSPCGDALSVDALRRAWSGAKPPGPAQGYALPLRMAWLLIGVVYFFPGLWKFLVSGTDWALSDNIKFKMYAKWFEWGGWEPIFRLDHYPLLYKAGGVFTIVLEMGFIFALFFPAARLVAVVSGLAFHQMNRLIMNITFNSLVISYVVFADWHRFFRWVGRGLFSKPTVLVYQNNSAMGRRVAALLQALDVFGGLEYKAVDQAQDAGLVFRLEPAPTGGRVWMALLVRVPLSLPVLPLLAVFGRRPIRTTTMPVPPSSKAAAVAGALLLGVNLLFGFTLVDTWPFAVYPTFASMDKPQTSSVILVALDAKGEVLGQLVPLANEPIRAAYRSPARLRALLRQIMVSTDHQERVTLLRPLLAIWRQHDAVLMRAHSVDVFRALFSTLPEDRFQVHWERQRLVNVVLED